jgi:hypothetical protein
MLVGFDKSGVPVEAFLLLLHESILKQTYKGVSSFRGPAVGLRNPSFFGIRPRGILAPKERVRNDGLRVADSESSELESKEACAKVRRKENVREKAGSHHEQGTDHRAL